jgi:hypothetical protein
VSAPFASLGFDPAPGHLATAAQVTRGVADTARALEEIAALLPGAAQGAWRGRAAIAFRDLLSHEFRPKVDTAARSFQAARRALEDWLETMRSSQVRARSLEAQHVEAVRRARSAHAALSGIPGATPPAGAAPTLHEAQTEAERQRARTAASRSASAADADVDHIEREARALLAEYEEFGRQVASRLQRATEIAPDEPGFWQRLADDVSAALVEVGTFAGDLDDHALQFLEEVAPLLRVIGDMAGLLSSVLGVLAFVPCLQFLALPALLVGLVALLADYGAAAGETGSFAEALTDGDVLMSAVGLVLGLGAAGASGRLVAAARTGSSTGAAGRPTTNLVRQLVGSRIEAPSSFFQLVRTASYSMGEQELVWRAVRHQANVGGLIHGLAELPGHRSTVEKLVDRNFGRLTQRPSAVA